MEKTLLYTLGNRKLDNREKKNSANLKITESNI